MFLELRHFLLKATENPKVVGQYLKGGGKPLELIQSLERIDKSQPFHISYVFNALQLTLIEILSESTQLTQPAVQACSYLMNSHRQCIEKLLYSPVSQHKRSVLKLLTAIVALEPQFGRDILATMHVVFNAETISNFTSHKKQNIDSEEDSIRTCYIHFIMSYLIEGNIMLIRNLLDRNELILALLSGLIYDNADTVILVLSSLHRFVLKSALVSKTKKVQVFNVDVVKKLLQLYEWKGPKYYAATLNKKMAEKAHEQIDVDEKTEVAKSAHEFLTTLLASRKFGVAFQCLGQRRAKSNTIQKHILSGLARPWTNDLIAELSIQIIKACPELARSFIKLNSPSMDPNNRYNDWFQAVNYFCKFTSEMTPSILHVGATDTKSIEMVQLVKALCMSPELLTPLRGKFTLRNDKDIHIRHKSTELLYLMFKQCNQHLYTIGTWTVYNSNDMRKLKFDLINHVFVFCPTVETILLSLHQTLQALEDPAMLVHLEMVLDLLLIISKSIPSFIEKTSSVINYIKILRPIYDLNRNDASSTRIELKAVQLILALEPKALSLQAEYFQQVIQSILNVFVLGSKSEQQQAKYLLRSVFQNTSLFENGPLEIDLWLEAFRSIDSDDLSIISSFFLSAILSFDDNADLERISIGETTAKNIDKLFEKIENGTTLHGIIDEPILSKFFHHIIGQLNETEDRDTCAGYLENVAFSLFHYLPSPAGISTLMTLECKGHKYTKYMQYPLTKGKLGPLTEHSITLLPKFYSSLQVGGEEFRSIFPKDGDNEHELLSNETHCMSLIYQTIFVVINENERGSFGVIQCDQTISYLKCLLEILHKLSAAEAAQTTLGFDVTAIEDDAFSKALKYIFCSRFYLLNHFTAWQDDDEQITRLIFEIVKFVSTLAPRTELINTICQHYRTKLANQIEVATTETMTSTNSERLLSLLERFNLEDTHCELILNSLTKVSCNSFITPEYTLSIYADILAFALKRLADVKAKALPANIVQAICKIYIELVHDIKVEINFECIEESLYNYFFVYYHCIESVPIEMFSATFECKKLTKSTIKLATLLLERMPDLDVIFLELLPANVSRKELVYPLLNVACRKAITFSAPILTALYNEFKNGILKTIEKPQKAGVIYKENIYSSLFLLERCMPQNECIDFCKKSQKFDSVEVFQLQIIKAIHLKCLQSDKPEIRQQVFINFVYLTVQLLGLLLKRDEIEYDKINAFATIISDWFKLRQLAGAEISFDKIVKAQNWSATAKSCLKYGLQRTDPKSEKSSILLKLFGFLCDQFYTDNTTAVDCGQFFEWAISHSEFFEISLQQQTSDLKTNLMYVLHVLIKKNTMPLKLTHVPILLGAYQAKLSKCDRYLLAILHQYEKSGIEMNAYRPFIWGESAISHYSIREAATKSTLYQEPPIMQALALIDRDIAETTLTAFPVWRRLNATEQVPVPEFKSFGIPGNEHLEMPSIASNRMEKLVDSNQFDPSLLLVASRKEDSFNEIYDPAFFIPLMSSAFAPEAFTRPVRPAQNGLLALNFAALSSQDKEMRLAGGNALLRYRSHLELSRFADSQIWFHLFDCVQRGAGNLTNEMRKHKKSRIPRVPFVAGVFLGKTVNTLMTPLHEMYRPLSNYLLFQKSYNFLAVPEFNVLFNSPDPAHITHRHFILEVLRDGVKCGSDFTILMTENIFKALFGFYNSPMATRDTNLLILTVINVAVKIPKSTKVMIESVGLLPWLSAIIDNVDFFQFDIIDGICNILNNVYYSLRFNHQEYRNIRDIEIRLFNCALKLCPELSTRTSQSSLGKYLNVLKNTGNELLHMISESNLDHLIKCARVHVKVETTVCNMSFIKKSNAKYADSKYSYVKQLRSLDLSESEIFICSILREIILNWLLKK